ncbi:MFS transporter, FHS family, L-fucose permease [Cladophialophora psammophila CBS 110553]|uniref:MFS transporter, FHS family, L-fucose permease n=1 Tax=Cladophialophora psammophila CBS 110553 TaxID=1182543 RepID=W9X705_9EURO|nr:MFS transporter, FHS family, L-fucose permease [Cladophialophora psammophila CBS 110553]EXJ75983.1 MFS transporter, FHS family, L-fucose permease [Cladophialophora psammophila CBS 110553]
MVFYKRKITVSDGEITNAAHLTLRQSFLPNCLVTILFFLWGFAYGLLDVLNSHFQTTLNITASRSSGLQAAYFGAYFLCPLTISGWILRRFGFRITFMTGLAVLAVGCLLFWPSGVKKSFGGFCGSMFVVGAGLSTLETAADPFLAICGPPRYSEIRLNLAQAVQGVGSFVAPLLASRVFFAHTVDTDQGLRNVQWTYLGVAGFVGVLIVLFFLAPMPEITDADMHHQEHVIAEYNPGPLHKQYTLFLGVWCQFCYVGAQVAVAGYFINFVKETGRSAATASDLLAAAQGIYAANRFIAGFLMMIPAVKPRYMLTLYLGMCCIISLIAGLTRGTTSVAFLMLVFVFESCCFATIFTMSLRGLGKHTKRGGSWLVAAISGGTVWPSMTGAVVTRYNAHVAMFIPMTGYIVGMVFPIYVNLRQRERMDMHRATEVGIVVPTEKELELERQQSVIEDGGKPQAVEIREEADLK